MNLEYVQPKYGEKIQHPKWENAIQILIFRLANTQLNKIDQRAMNELNQLESIEMRIPTSEEDFDRVCWISSWKLIIIFQVLYDINNYNNAGDNSLTDFSTLRNQPNQVKSFASEVCGMNFRQMQPAIKVELDAHRYFYISDKVWQNKSADA